VKKMMFGGVMKNVKTMEGKKKRNRGTKIPNGKEKIMLTAASSKRKPRGTTRSFFVVGR
jgi:hypothetical protein